MSEQNKEFLDVWNATCTTDPRHVKAFSRGGGFSGSAINHTYQIRKATELWGPMGHLWSVKIVEQGLMPGTPIVVEELEQEWDVDHGDDGNATRILVKETTKKHMVAQESIHFVRIQLSYPIFATEPEGQTRPDRNRNSRTLRPNQLCRQEQERLLHRRGSPEEILDRCYRQGSVNVGILC